MVSLGQLIHRVLRADKQNPIHDLLFRIFEEQFQIYDGLVVVRPKEQISSDSVQSQHDPESSYRNKNDQSVKGYTLNKEDR